MEEYLNPDNKNSINTDKKIWSAYEKTRANYLEAEGIEYLSNCLKFANIYRNLEYTIVENGKKKKTELDGLLLLDNLLFIVEAKAGTLSLPARRGAPSMVEDLKELVDNAYKQALRAKKYISENEKSEFILPNGEIFCLSKEDIEKIYLVNITLENLDSFIVNLYKLRELGLVSESEFPWSVCITDLRIISEIVATSCEFVHYLSRRLRINELEFVEAHDEIDWFSHYLHEGLYFENYSASDNDKQIFTLGSYTSSFDDYYYHKLGYRTKAAPKPRQPMPKVFQQFINELEQVHKRGYIKAASALLDMDDEGRKDFSKAVLEIKRRTIHDRKAHNFTLEISETKLGITCICLPQERFFEIPSILDEYCVGKRNELGLEKWIGFGINADSDKFVSYLLVIDK